MIKDAWANVLQEIDHCNKCGFCLPACPTYQLTGNELHSPRGRIALTEALARQEIEVNEVFEDSLGHCLACRACETACPSGVHYVRILEAGKEQLHRKRPASAQLSFVSRQALRLVKKPKRFGLMVGIATSLKNAPLPTKLKQMTLMLGYEKEFLPKVTATKTKGQVAFFAGCAMSAVFPDVNKATQNLLESAGLEVIVPPKQGCCGALHAHAGQTEEAKTMARVNIDAFLESGADVKIANTAGGCGAMMLEYDQLLKDDPLYADKAVVFVARVRDWATVLCQEGEELSYLGVGERVTLQNSCHLVNVEKAGGDEVALIAKVNGDIFVPLNGQDTCCGSAGIYNLEHPDWALQILDNKMIDVKNQQAERILVNNPGCHLQMRLGSKRAYGEAAIPVEHVAHYLYRAHLRSRGE